MKSFLESLLLGAACVSLSACAAVRNTAEVAVDYNRAFADSRNEMLLLNILRAGAREPLQFSAMGTVTGTVRPSGSITLPFSGLVNGEDLSISPEVTINDGVNPNINVLPLGHKEFTQGLLRPVSSATIDLFLGQGWDRELILPLVLGGVQCSSEHVLIVKGTDKDNVPRILKAAREARRFDIVPSEVQVSERIVLPAKDALALLKDGVGEDWTVSLPEETAGDDKKQVGKRNQAAGTTAVAEVPQKDLVLEIAKSEGMALKDVHLEDACISKLREGPTSGDTLARINALFLSKNSLPDSSTHRDFPVVMRSPAGMIYFLGDLHRRLFRNDPSDCDGDVYRSLGGIELRAPGAPRWIDERDLVAIVPCDYVPPVDAAVVTKFRGRHYYIPRHATATLEVLSFLSDLIALQTSESTMTAGNPVIAITQQ